MAAIDDGGPPAGQGAYHNRILRALSDEDFAWIQPHLEPVTLGLRDVVCPPDIPPTHVYFPETGVVSMVSRMSDGSTVEVGTIGPEGMSGIQAVVAGGTLPSETFVQVAGVGYRTPAELITVGAMERLAFRKVLDRYFNAFLIQVAQTAACNRAHPVEQRCARWLLMTHDRVGQGGHFELTHEFLAFMLGVRRASVSVAAGALQRSGVIRYARGRVTVIDRAGLERAACECYGVVRAQFDRLMGGETPLA